MCRSAIRTNLGLFRRLNLYHSFTSFVRLPSKQQSSREGDNAYAASSEEDPRLRTGCGSLRPSYVHVPNVCQFQGSTLPALQNRLMASQSKPLSQLNGTIRHPIHPHVGSQRVFSGKSDEKENIDKKQASSFGHSPDKDGKEKGCEPEKPGKQSIETSAISESGETEIMLDQSARLKNSERQPPSLDTHSDLEKRKKDQKLHTTKKRNRIWSKNRKSPDKPDSTLKIGDNDRLELLKEKLIWKLGKRWLSWDKIKDTFDDFPNYVSENTRDLLIEAAAARLKQYKYSKFGETLSSSAPRILLCGEPGTEIYQEALVKAVTRHLQASLLVLDSKFLLAKDVKGDARIAGLLVDEDDDDHDDDDDNKETARKTWQADKNGNAKIESIKPLNNLVIEKIFTTKEFEKVEEKLGKAWKLPHEIVEKDSKQGPWKTVDMENNGWTDELKKLVLAGREDELRKLGKRGDELKKLCHDLVIGDRVKFNGAKDLKSKSRSKLKTGQEGFVTSISDGLPWKVCVKFQGRHGAGEVDEVFCDARELEKVESSASDEALLARFPELPIEALCKMVSYKNPVIVHFLDIQQWFSKAVPVKGRGLLLSKVGDLLSKVNGPVVFIAGRIKEDVKPAVVQNDIDSIIQELLSISGGHQNKPVLKDNDEEDLKGGDKIYKIFRNVIKIFPPEGQLLLRAWRKQLEDDKRTTLRKRNLMILGKSLAYYSLACAELSEVDTLDCKLTKTNAEKVIGWARNMSLSNNSIQINEGKLWLEKGSLERSLARFKALNFSAEDKMTHVTELAENDYEKSLLPSVIFAHDVGVKFDEIGALDDVKRTLKDLIVLPLQRPELFKKGNLRKPCKGVLLFGPPGTGKTLLAKAVATEAGANFVNISASSITSKYYGDDEKLVKALFALARKLTPAVIFIDEVDSLLGARGGSSEHEATRRIKNEFMATWDGLQSKENEQILVLAATNRPFDLDDAVVRRLPRRLLVDLPSAENRIKILQIILAQEDLSETFDFTALAGQTEGYSGSDLKNLCVAAAYRPIREFLAAEEQGKMGGPGSRAQHYEPAIALRPLCLEDFIQSKSTIGASVAFDAASMVQLRKWNEQYGEGGSRSQKVFGFSQ